MILPFVIIFVSTTVTTTLLNSNESTNLNLSLLFQLNISSSPNKLGKQSLISEPVFPVHIMNNMNSNQLYFLEEISQSCASLLDSGKIQVWLLAVLSSCLIGVSSMFPLFVISISSENCLMNSDSSSKTLMKYLLSFAVGGLLGDVFLHLLPEAYNQIIKSGIAANNVQIYMGFWILCGIFSFGLMEVIFSHINVDKEDAKEIDGYLVNGCHNKSDVNNLNNGNGVISNGGIINGHVKHDEREEKSKSMNVKENNTKKVNIIGYLNLLANGFDNLTHGLAVGASFLVSIKMGLLTTFAIVIHEIPHEIADFAILLKSGFNKWDAVKAQVSIAGVTILGSIIILCADSADIIGIKTAWILPFTSGGFLHIALVSILPELLSEPNLNQSLKQAFFIASGITVMAFVNLIGE